ncbi:udp-transferase [Botrytis cinerea]
MSGAPAETAANSGPTLADGPAQIPLQSRSLSATKTDLPAADITHNVQQEEEKRPDLAPTKVWQTERPRATTKSSLLAPAYKRGETNTSLLNEAIWSRGPDYKDDGSTSSSSSSSSEDEEDAPAEKKKRNYVPGKKNVVDTGGRKQYNKFQVGNDDYSTRGRVSKRDGRLNISFNETNNRGYLAKALGATFFSKVEHDDMTGETPEANLARRQRGKLSRPSAEEVVTSNIPRPRLNIVVMVIGSRGDIQPFLKLGKSLKEYGHRVRIATHPAFRDFVQKDSGLEFFSVGGDPAELMAFMVKNPGMIPTMETLKKGEVGRRREQMAEMFEGFWRACINATDEEKDVTNLKMMGDKEPFVADAIIANPPCFAHIHCAERLGVPLHLMFTFPYTPTQSFPHPLANIKKTNVDPGYTNFMSYPLVEMMTWQGLGDLVNNFRVKTLGLEPVSTLWAPGQLYRLKVPYTYLWSPGLVPKPKDWGPEIDIAGFVFLDLADTFTPPDDLVKFLDDGEPPVYIGFGSIVVDDPDRFTEMIFEAVKKAGVRALVSKGWGGLGGENTPDNVFMLENTPHDWLFPKVKAVVHHGGAGTTAIGLKCGKPTMIVPFSVINSSGAEGIKQCLTDKAREAVEKIAKDIEAEGDGAQNAVKSFHRSLKLRGEHSMRCSILEDRVAVWTMKGTNLRLSALAAELLVERKKITWKQLRLIRHHEWNDFEGPGEPISGVTTAVTGTVTGIAAGVGSIPFKVRKTIKRRSVHEEKKKRKSEDTRKSESGTTLVEKKPDSQEHADNSNASTLNNQTIQEESRQDENSGPSKEIKNINSATETHDTNPEAAANSPCDAGMANHTTSGEPTRQHSQANREEQQNSQTKNIDNQSMLSSDPINNEAEAVVKDIGHGFGETAEAVARAPMDLALALAQGFHNAPRLYGDTTVRRPTRITGMKSGLKAAGEEFIFGIYDGVTGLVVQPYTGARDHGALGFVKGVGMGLTGFVLKDISAIVGPFGYTLKGVHKEMVKNKQPTAFIRKARMLQGQRDIYQLNRDSKERKGVEDRVTHGWNVILEVWKLMDEKKRDGGLGLKGKLKVMRERRTWRSNGAFEGVGAAEKAVQAKKRGDKGGVKAVFKKQRKELEKAERPRKGVAAELEDDKIRRQQGVEGNNEGEGEVHPETGHDERQVVVEEGSAKPEGKDIPQLIA